MKPSSFDPDSFISDVAWGMNHDAFQSPASIVALRNYQLGICDDLNASILGKDIKKLKQQEMLGNLNPFRLPRLCNGELKLGVERYCMPLQALTAGTLLLGNTGSGKTNFELILLLQIAACGCPFWVSENYKKQFRHLRPLLRRLGNNLVILRAKDWKWNLLQALGDARIHNIMATDLLTRLLEAPPRAQIILRQTIHALYEKFGIWKGQSKTWPTLFDLYALIYATKGLNEAARDAILDRLGALLVALTPQCAAYRSGWTATDLAKHCIVFEMLDASEQVKQVLLEPTLFSLFQYEIERGVINGKLSLAVAFDDSQRFFARPTTNELTPMDELAGIIRGSGKSLLIALQTLNGLSPKLSSNLANKFFGRLGSGEDYNAIAADMGLTAAQRDWARLHLKPGMFIGQIGTADWRQPFVFQTPLINLPPTATDAEAGESVRALDNVPVVFAPEFAHWQPHSLVEIHSQAPSSRLSDIEVRFLKTVIAQPGKPSGIYTKSLGINGRRAAEIRRRLVDAGYVREHPLATGTRGRTAIVLEPLPPAFEVISEEK